MPVPVKAAKGKTTVVPVVGRGVLDAPFATGKMPVAPYAYAWASRDFSVAMAVSRFFSNSSFLPQLHSQDTPPV